MKHIPKRAAIPPMALPMVLAATLTLTACDADFAGDTNGGLGASASSSNLLLLAGGAVGLAALLNSSDSGSTVAPQVGTESGDDSSEENGGGDNGSDSGNGESGNDNASGDEANDSAAGLFQPPAWLKGMWRGTSADGTQRIAYATANDIGGGTAGNIASYSAIEGATVEVIQQTDSVYEYRVSYTYQNNPVSFTEKWENNTDGSVVYSANGDSQNAITMNKVPATDFLAPPQWMQGSWASEDFRATVSSGNITYGAVGEPVTDVYALASVPGSVLIVTLNTAADYRFKLITSTGEVIDHHFGIFDDNTLAFASKASKSSAFMIRQ